MTTDSTVLVEYIGQKNVKTDNVAGSGVVWHGPGDVQPVSPAQWAAMSRHTGVWQLASAASLKVEGGLLLGHADTKKADEPEQAAKPARKTAAKTKKADETDQAGDIESAGGKTGEGAE